MTVLEQRPLNAQLPLQRAMLDAGGLWFAPAPASPAAVVEEVRQRGIRALETHSRDISFLAGLTQLEFLTVLDVDEPSPIHTLKKLRFLHVAGTWRGNIDFRELPQLEVFSVVECPAREGGLETLYSGHAALRVLHIQRYRHADLTPLSRLSLATLGIGYARTLNSLQGLGDLAATLRTLCLHACPNLVSLQGIDVLTGLVSLELGGLRHIRTLEFVRSLPLLRHLDVFELKDVDSLWPLAGHDALEFLSFGRVRDLDLDPLDQLPRLKLFLTGTHRWNRDLHSLPYAHDLPDGHPHLAEWRSLQA